jgi:2-keto-3-deoxy-L-rhamnonate aldolase RhmA
MPEGIRSLRQAEACCLNFGSDRLGIERANATSCLVASCCTRLVLGHMW